MNHIDQMVAKSIQMQKVTELGLMGMMAQLKRGNLEKAEDVGRKIMAGLREKTEEIHELATDLNQAIQKITIGGNGQFSRFLEIALSINFNDRSTYGMVHDVVGLLQKVATYKNVADLVGSHLIDDIFQEKYNLHTRQLQTNRYQLRKFNFIEVSRVLFYEDVAPSEDDLAEINALTYVTGNDVFSFVNIQPGAFTAAELMTLIDALPITGESRPEWMKSYAKVAWFHFDDMLKLSQYLKSVEGQIYKKHYLVQILEKSICVDCGKAWKGQPKKPCAK
jgi:hypothetical protein